MDDDSSNFDVPPRGNSLHPHSEQLLFFNQHMSSFISSMFGSSAPAASRPAAGGSGAHTRSPASAPAPARDPVAEYERSSCNLIDHIKQLERDKARMAENIKTLEQQNEVLKRENQHLRNRSSSSGGGGVPFSSSSGSSSRYNQPSSFNAAPAPPQRLPKVSKQCKMIVVSSLETANTSSSVRDTLARDFAEAAAPHNDRFDLSAVVDHRDNTLPEDLESYDAACYVIESDAREHAANFLRSSVSQMQSRTKLNLVFAVVVERGGKFIGGVESDAVFVSRVKLTERESWVEESKRFLSAVTAALAK